MVNFEIVCYTVYESKKYFLLLLEYGPKFIISFKVIILQKIDFA